MSIRSEALRSTKVAGLFVKIGLGFGLGTDFVSVVRFGLGMIASSPGESFDMKTLFAGQAVIHIVLASLVLAQTESAPGAGGDVPPNELRMEWVLRQSLEHYPALKAARAHRKAMSAGVAQAAAWEDPRLGVHVERDGTTRLERHVISEWTIAQQVPISGRNRQQARAAMADAAAAFAEVQRLELEVTTRVRIAFFRAANSQTQLELNLEQQQTLMALMDKVHDKPQPVARTQADLLIGQVELALLTEHRFDLERELSDQRSQLNLLMDRPPHAILPPVRRPTFEPLAPSPFATAAPGHTPDDPARFDWTLFERHAQELALGHWPGLTSARHSAEAAQARYTASRRQWIPDPELLVATRRFYTPSRGSQGYGVGIEFNVPWLNWRKHQAGIQAARAEVERARHDLETWQSETMARARDLVRRAQVAQQHYESFRDEIVPLAVRALEAAELNYLADQANFWELLMTFRTQRESEMMRFQHLTEYWETLAKLEAVIGLRLAGLAGIQGSSPSRD
jgi:outer membrane protein, heavy metal efflux system